MDEKKGRKADKAKHLGMASLLSLAVHGFSCHASCRPMDHQKALLAPQELQEEQKHAGCQDFLEMLRGPICPTWFLRLLA